MKREDAIFENEKVTKSLEGTAATEGTDWEGRTDQTGSFSTWKCDIEGIVGIPHVFCSGDGNGCRFCLLWWFVSRAMLVSRNVEVCDIRILHGADKFAPGSSLFLALREQKSDISHLWAPGSQRAMKMGSMVPKVRNITALNDSLIGQKFLICIRIDVYRKSSSSNLKTVRILTVGVKAFLGAALQSSRMIPANVQREKPEYGPRRSWFVRLERKRRLLLTSRQVRLSFAASERKKPRWREARHMCEGLRKLCVAWARNLQ